MKGRCWSAQHAGDLDMGIMGCPRILRRWKMQALRSLGYKEMEIQMEV